MFFSHTYLARKGPLGSVWCAAHLQHKLKKSQYLSTDIPSTVDFIMFPEVPFALRMSGHLLLGVVRIYSKKVDYLFHDCNVALIGLKKAFTATTDVNLPENAKTAKFESVTLPQILDLDAVDISDAIYIQGSPDTHLRSQEDITINDQVPFDRDLYVAITFDEDIIMDSSPPENNHGSVAGQVEDILPPLDVVPEDIGPSNQTEANRLNDPALGDPMDIQDSGPSNRAEFSNENLDHGEPGPSQQPDALDSMVIDSGSPGIEIMRDATQELGTESFSPLRPDVQTDASKPDKSPDRVSNEKGNLSPILNDTLSSGEKSMPFQQRSDSPSSSALGEAPELDNIHVPSGIVSPELALRSTPPVQKPQQRRRKRKLFFDENTVLSNKFMKKSLEDSTDLLRKRKNSPSSALGIWKLKDNLGKEQIFCQSLLTGSCADICNLFQNFSVKSHMILDQEVVAQTRVANSPDPETVVIPELTGASSPALATGTIPEPEDAAFTDPATQDILRSQAAATPAPEPAIDMEVECLRHHESHGATGDLDELFPSPIGGVPSPRRIVSTPLQRDDFTPMGDFESETAVDRGTTLRSGLTQTSKMAVSTGTYGSEIESPRTFLEEFSADRGGLSDIPELTISPEADDLYFLEADHTPAGSPGSQGIDTLSVRTRAVAQYLKRHSPDNPNREESSLSLDNILQGRTRKLCARMFYETLVLSTHGLVGVKQAEPYGDVNLKITSTLSKAKI